MSSITDHEPAQARPWGFYCLMEYHKHCLGSIVNLLCPQLKWCQMRGPREREERIAESNCGTCSPSHAVCPAVSTATGCILRSRVGSKVTGSEVWWKACLEAVMSFSREWEGIKLCALIETLISGCAVLSSFINLLLEEVSFINQHHLIRWIFSCSSLTFPLLPNVWGVIIYSVGQVSLSLSTAAFFAFKDVGLCLLPSTAFTPGPAALALTLLHLLGLASCSAPQKTTCVWLWDPAWQHFLSLSQFPFKIQGSFTGERKSYSN